MFRSTSLEQLSYFLTHLGLQWSRDTRYFGYTLFFFGLPLLLMDGWQYVTQDALVVTKLRLWWRTPLYSLILLWMFVFGVRESLEFIYFQF